MFNKGLSSLPKQASGETPFSRALFNFSRSPSLIELNNSSLTIEEEEEEEAFIYFFENFFVG